MYSTTVNRNYARPRDKLPAMPENVSLTPTGSRISTTMPQYAALYNKSGIFDKAKYC